MVCLWFFKIIFVFNFVFFIDLLVMLNFDNDFVLSLFGNGFFIVKFVYNVLFIDYRLLCCLLFLEYFLELMDVCIN